MLAALEFRLSQGPVWAAADAIPVLARPAR